MPPMYTFIVPIVRATASTAVTSRPACPKPTEMRSASGTRECVSAVTAIVAAASAT